LTTDF